MAAPYAKRYPGGFLDLPTQSTPVDSAFLNAVESALLQLLGEVPAADEVGVWVGGSGGGLVYQKITNAQIAAGAAIDKSKLAALSIVDADVAGGAAIAKSKLGALNIANADVVAGAAIARNKIADVDQHIRLTRTAAQSIPNATVTLVQWDSVLENVGGMTLTASGGGAGNTTVKIGVAGYYLLTWQIRFEANATGYREASLNERLTRNLGYDLQDGNSNVFNSPVMKGAMVAKIPANNEIELSLFQSSGAALNLEKNGELSPKLTITRI